MKNAKAIFTVILVTFLWGCNASVLEEKGGRNADYQSIHASTTIVFIHGMYLTPITWREWELQYQSLGYTTFSPAWPLHDLPIAEQNATHPNTALAELTLSEILQYYRDFIAALEEKPILIGHSMGGLITQILLSEGIAAGGIAINSAPPQGVISAELNFLKANQPHIDPFLSVSKPTQLTFGQFQFGFVNNMPLEEQKNAYAKYAVPESRRVGRSTLTSAAKVDATIERPPLLLISGGDDHTIPASLSYSNFLKYGNTPSVTDYKQFPERNHWTILQNDWELVAGYIDDWIEVNKLPMTLAESEQVFVEQ